MGSVTGAGAAETTASKLPNFVGELFSITPADTPFLSMIGGLTGGMSVTAPQHTWQTVDNAAAAQPSVAEGATATAAERTRSEVVNVAQIHQERVDLTYTKMAATGLLSGESILGNQPVMDEMAFQLRLKIEKIARDVEFSFMQGTYANPGDGTARGTRGLDNAISTNTVAAGSTDLSRDHIQDALRQMADSGAPFRNTVLFANAFNKQRVTDIYAYAPESRNVGGVNINQIETDFGMLGVAYDRHVPTDTVFIVEVSECKPFFLNIPGKGHFFSEVIETAGATDAMQIYGEIGLEYGPELHHALINGTTTS